MPQRLHLVFGGELTSPQTNTFRAVAAIPLVGMFPEHATADLAWKAEAQLTVDNAHMRYFIANIHRPRAQTRPGSQTGPMTT